MQRVAVVGCGVISAVYAETLGQLGFVEIVSCVDLLNERATRFAQRFGVRVANFDEVVDDPNIDAVLNLTEPKAHAAVTRLALAAGRSVFSEKPLGIEHVEGAELVQLASDSGVRLGCAPDTFLGRGLQTARTVIDRGDIGAPLAANAFLLAPGPEAWHPNPEIFYEQGAGPLFDMGPYYLTALIQLLGPVRSVTATTRISPFPRTIGSGAGQGRLIDVEAPTYVTSILEHASGPVSTCVLSFDAQASRCPHIEIYGTEGTLVAPDPNSYEGPVQIGRLGDEKWRDVDLVPSALPQQRGIGLADMLWAQRTGRPHRASSSLALHVLEVMTTTIASAQQGRRLDLTTTTERAAILPAGVNPDAFDF